MKPPSYSEIVHSERILSEDAAPTDRLFALVIKYIDAVLTDEERIDIKDLQHEEIVEFLESMTSEQFTKIREYMENQPILKHDVNFSCESCGFQNNFTLEGLQDFF